MAHAELRREGGSLLFLSDYDAAMVNALKANVPPDKRRWDKANKAWVVDPMYGASLVKLAKDYLNVNVQMPLILNSHAPTTRLLKVEYLGRTKERYSGELTAFGWVDGDWNVVFPERVLLKWFDADAPSRKANSLYGALAVPQSALVEEIKSAYRRMARQWHPDVCQEPDAKERFIEIQHAYEVLSNELTRRKYDAGLTLERTLKAASKPADVSGYRAPLLCGYILCMGAESLGRFVVSDIKAWQDIVDEQGRVMVSSWPMGADKFVARWI